MHASKPGQPAGRRVTRVMHESAPRLLHLGSSAGARSPRSVATSNDLFNCSNMDDYKPRVFVFGRRRCSAEREGLVLPVKMESVRLFTQRRLGSAAVVSFDILQLCLGMQFSHNRSKKYRNVKKH